MTSPLRTLIAAERHRQRGGLALAALCAAAVTTSSVLLLGLALWAACRCYYFAFYVLHHYVDPSFRYSGLLSLVRYLFQRKKKP